jgi:hypothetical protein
MQVRARAGFVLALVCACGRELRHDPVTTTSGGLGGQGGAASGRAASGGTAVAAPCWDGGVWAELPPCVMIDACFPDAPAITECVQTGDCTFTFAKPIGASLNVSADCARVANGSWTLSGDQQTLSLTGPACEQARASGNPRILAQSEHSCIVAAGGAPSTGGSSSGGVPSGGTATGGATSWTCLDGPQVLSQLGSCSYALPSPPAGYVMSTTGIEVLLTTSAAGTVPLTRAPNDDCSQAGEWFFANFDANNSPTEIELCPGTCAVVQSDSNASVSMQLMCMEEP